MRRFGLAAALAAAAAMLIGCPTASTLGMARTLDQGKFQVYAAPALADAASPGINGTGGGNLFFPTIEGGFRYGVTDMSELGARLGFFGVELQSKFALVRTPTLDSGVDFSLAPSLTLGGGSSGSGSAFMTSVTLPFLVGFNFGGNQLILGPKVADQLVFGGNANPGGFANVVYIGGSVGYALRLLPNFRILPEVALLAPVTPVQNVGSSAGAGWTTFQLSCGFLFGGFDE